MGVWGLTSYLKRKRDWNYKFYALQDCYLVVDGRNFLTGFYQSKGLSSEYNGEYLAYELAEELIKNFQKCGVTPIFVFDGPKEVSICVLKCI